MTDFRGGLFWNFKQGFKVTILKYMINISGNQCITYNLYECPNSHQVAALLH